jgi:hypothetical protein
MRRQMLVLLAVTGTLAFSSVGLSADSDQASAYQRCAQSCSDCQRACDMCAAQCAHLLAQGKKDHLRTLQTCQDCATHCAAAACIVSRQGPFSGLICRACAEACAICGKECEKFGDDPHMKKCAEECRKCEKACREMLSHVDEKAPKG